MIKNTRIIFNLDSCFWIELESEDTIKNADFRDESIVFLCRQNHEKLILEKDTIKESLSLLKVVLVKALSNNLHLDYSITKNIGYLHNEEMKHSLPYLFRDNLFWNKNSVNDRNYIEKKDELKYKMVEELPHWIGFDYQLWEYEVVTWLYNTGDKDIVFEVTPKYPGHWLDPEKTAFVVYEEWIKTYKPILKKVIPHEVAKKWLIDTQKVLDIIEKNIQKYCDTHCDESSHYYRKEE